MLGKALATLTLAIGLTALSSTDAHAWFKVCNDSSSKVWVSYADQASCGLFDSCNDGCSGTYDVHMRGWYAIAAGSCATLNGDQAYQYHHWVYAENGKGGTWSSRNLQFFDPQIAFDRCCDPGLSTCEPRVKTYPSRWLWHHRADTSSTNMTLHLR